MLLGGGCAASSLLVACVAGIFLDLTSYNVADNQLGHTFQHVIILGSFGVASVTSMAEKGRCAPKGSANLMLAAALVSAGWVLGKHGAKTQAETEAHSLAGMALAAAGFMTFGGHFLNSRRMYHAVPCFVLLAGWTFWTIAIYWSTYITTWGIGAEHLDDHRDVMMMNGLFALGIVALVGVFVCQMDAASEAEEDIPDRVEDWVEAVGLVSGSACDANNDGLELA
eukprot:TRINITY_DN1479_c0_g3_i1.p1 TRINITY_DN1479_c0_g3~~TRINITY_DN1479_c0_g3_i1.p1  ORF type:complete len:225 (+),score=23.64 TRINITY_DN1479_c0_g3_i1:233-907(+)